MDIMEESESPSSSGLQLSGRISVTLFEGEMHKRVMKQLSDTQTELSNCKKQIQKMDEEVEHLMKIKEMVEEGHKKTKDRLQGQLKTAEKKIQKLQEEAGDMRNMQMQITEAMRKSVADEYKIAKLESSLRKTSAELATQNERIQAMDTHAKASTESTEIEEGDSTTRTSFKSEPELLMSEDNEFPDNSGSVVERAADDMDYMDAILPTPATIDGDNAEAASLAQIASTSFEADETDREVELLSQKDSSLGHGKLDVSTDRLKIISNETVPKILLVRKPKKKSVEAVAARLQASKVSTLNSDAPGTQEHFAVVHTNDQQFSESDQAGRPAPSSARRQSTCFSPTDATLADAPEAGYSSHDAGGSRSKADSANKEDASDDGPDELVLITAGKYCCLVAKKFLHIQWQHEGSRRGRGPTSYDNPFRCKSCRNATFKRAPTLVDHVWETHMKETFFCPHCTNPRVKFTSREKISSHAKKFHSLLRDDNSFTREAVHIHGEIHPQEKIQWLKRGRKGNSK